MRLSNAPIALSVLVCMSLAANGQPRGDIAGSVPTISGRYVTSRIATCFTTELTVSHLSGSAVFNPNSGTVSVNGFESTGEPPQLNQFSATVSYSNSATDITVDGNVYKIFYGKIAKGIATEAFYIGVVPITGGACTYQLTISRAGAR